MARDSLIATPTVDKNGKSTTVYRRTASSGASKTLPGPKLAGSKRGAQKRSTPLPQPDPISEQEFERYRKALKENLSLRKRPDRMEAALIRRILEGADVSQDALRYATSYMGDFSVGERVSHYDYNALLIIERVCRDEGSEMIINATSLFMDAIEGLARRRREADSQTVPLIETEEELAAHAAVVKMLVAVGRKELDSGHYGDLSLKVGQFYTADRTRHSGASFKNHAFTALLRERPEDYKKIEGYVMQRGAPKTKSDVDLLREYLDPEHAQQALAEGWL